MLRNLSFVIVLLTLAGCGIDSKGPVGVRPETHVVAKGETLASIAASYDLQQDSILLSNWEELHDAPTNLEAGMKLRIPPDDGLFYRWSEGDTLARVASFFDVPPEAILTYPGNNLTAEMIASQSLQDLPPGTLILVPGGTRPLVQPPPDAPGFSNEEDCRLWYPTLPARCMSSIE